MAQTKRRHIEYDQDDGHLITGDLGAPDEAAYEEEAYAGPSVGELLREAREQAGYEVREIAALLRIRPVFVEAIEQGRYSELPGAVYTTGFIRSYAELMGFDAEAMVERFRHEGQVMPRKPQLTFPAPVPEGSRVPSGAIIMVAALVAVVGYAGWYFLSSTNRDLADSLPTLPDRFLALLTGTEADEVPEGPTVEPAEPSVTATRPPATDTDAPRVAVVAAPAAEDGIAQDPAPDDDAATAETAAPAPAAATTVSDTAPPAGGTAASGASTAATTPPPVAPGLSFGGRDGDAADTGSLGVQLSTGPIAATDPAATAPANPAAPRSIVLRAVAESWVQVETAEGRILYSRVMAPGETYTVPADRSGLKMVTGNARGLQITVAGEPIPGWGERIGVVRNIALDPDQLMNGTAF